MIRFAGELIEHIKACVAQGAGPRTRIIIREGEFGPEREIDCVKMRGKSNGVEIILQTKSGVIL